MPWGVEAKKCLGHASSDKNPVGSPEMPQNHERRETGKH